MANNNEEKRRLTQRARNLQNQATREQLIAALNLLAYKSSYYALRHGEVDGDDLVALESASPFDPERQTLALESKRSIVSALSIAMDLPNDDLDPDDELG